MIKNIAILGSTGSIGIQTLEVARNLPGISVKALAAHSNIDLLSKQIMEFKPDIAAVLDKGAGDRLKQNLNTKTKILTGPGGIIAAARYGPVDTVVNAVVGSAGLLPTLEAIWAKKDIALANKETLVAAGELVTNEASKNGVSLIPIDSEHSAIFQCISGNDKNVSKIYLTASGGPFRGKTKGQLFDVSPEEALKHPRWSMGKKITIDSATLMNKGLELIEAKWLFGIGLDKIQVLIHKESIIHSMAEFSDGAIIAQLGVPDMRTPIQYALTYPERAHNDFGRLDFIKLKSLSFEEPDTEVFECLALAVKASEIGGTMPAAMNMANECAVELFLDNKIRFLDIPVLVKDTMELHKTKKIYGIDDIIETEKWVRGYIETYMENYIKTERLR